MKKLFFILLLISSQVGYSQNDFNANEFITAFGTLVDNNLQLFGKADISIIDQTSISPKLSLEKQLTSWAEIPVSKDFTDGSPQKKDLLKQLDQVCDPLWKKSFASDQELVDVFKEIESKFMKQENGKLKEYLFVRLVTLKIVEMMILGPTPE